MERKVIYHVESGSYLYGTNTEKSDKDYVSVFIPTNYDLLSLQKCDYIDDSTKKSSEDRRNTSEDIDNQKHSISNYLHLVLIGNPNLIEILFATNPIIEDPVFSIFKDNTNKLISKNVFKSFSGFAFSQKKKLEYKAKRFTQLEKSLEYLEKEYAGEICDPSAIMGEDLSEWLNNNLSEYKGRKNNVESFHVNLPVKPIYEVIKNEYEKYGWRTKTDTFITLGYDVKFASHAIRLFYEGERLLTTGRLEFPITGKALNDIMNVKDGKLSINEFYELCDYYDNLNVKAHESSLLPEKSDWKWVNENLVRILETEIIREAALKARKMPVKSKDKGYSYPVS
ncbi:MAG: nucleotidyltransferase domain-containing protein [Treponema sp.]|jgi:predicted nucleotidyltransferase|nr:nucleotidyltransferase domain-containing protein [Treponema sp.]